MKAKRNLTIDDHTIAQQERASNPGHSAWVSANAGSGKTHVLSQRVVRLLLKGTDPSKILCLTFTKAAAGEMSNRVFEILGRWTTMPDAVLEEELKYIEGRPPNIGELAHARTLFARALETPGGLKIQTIHAFCEALLHQFPLEANVPGHFTVMDERQQRRLVEDARRAVLLEADAEPESETGRAFAQIMDTASDHAIEKVMSEIVSQHDELDAWLNAVGGTQQAEENARKRFQFSPDDTVEDLQTQAINTSAFSSAKLQNLAEIAALSDKITDQKLAERLNTCLEGETSSEKFEQLSAVFLTGGKPRKFGSFATAQVKAQFTDLEEKLETEGARLVAAGHRINTLKLIVHTSPLLKIAQSIINRYQAAKKQQGLLDFDDLVARTADLLTRQSARQWVLYKLDLGIDHILLDEAQDTSPRQWQIIDALAEEFYAGKSARNSTRTLFAVGDEKQSIYSFQGAEPARFAQQRRDYSKLARSAEKPLINVLLGLSFRSTQDILSAVDEVFSKPENAQGITFDEPPPPHTAARRNQRGSVDVWPLELAEATDPPKAWEVPQDQFGASHQAIRLADKIAAQIKDWLGKERLEASGRLITPGDILVLVRARDRFMTALNRALKEAGVPVAGADRLSLTDHIAVQDLMALGQVMLTPEDDLSLAAVLKSPLIGIDEEQLYRLARNRLHKNYETSLFEALTLEKDNPEFCQAYSKLAQWRSRVDQLPVYEFYGRLLGEDGGNRAFYSRLGSEAEDVLDAFLALTLTHEQNGLPGLQAFLQSLNNDTPEIKREMDQSAGEVRVMTVHAAKGLEAPVVFLVDKCSAAFQSRHAPALYHWGEQETASGYFWVPQTSAHGDATLPLLALEKEKAEQEHRRLLYVGMTRAEDRLIVCGYGPKPNKDGELKLPEPNWHNMVSHALEPDWTPVRDEAGALLYHRWYSPGSVSGKAKEVIDDTEPENVDRCKLPGWIDQPLPQENALPRPLSPSRAQALIDEALTGESSVSSLLKGRDTAQGQTPRQRGTAIHRLLQVLPDREKNQWQGSGLTFLERSLPQSSAADRTEIMNSVERTLTSETLAAYFDPSTSRAEVPIMGRIDLKSGPRSVAGTIDRLAVLKDEIVLLDYKTSPFVPGSPSDVSNDYMTQMALYQALVARLYSDRPVRAALVWTSTPKEPNFMWLPEKMLADALTKIAQI